MFEKGYILFSLYSSYSPSSRNVGLYQFCFPVTAEVPSFLQLHCMYCNLTVSPTSLCFLTPLCYPTSQLLTYPLMSAHVPVSMKPDEAKFNLYTFRFFLLHVILLNTQLVIFCILWLLLHDTLQRNLSAFSVLTIQILSLYRTSKFSHNLIAVRDGRTCGSCAYVRLG